MTAADHALLAELTWQLSRFPWAPALRIHGVWMSRESARAMERQLLRLRVAARRRERAREAVAA